jgi:ATP-dependent RNA helicase SUPV3L1/SUV3
LFNRQIRRVIFTTLVKWDGRQEVPLSFSQVKQIGGRAGRYGMKSKVSSPSAPDEIEPVEITGDGVASITVDENVTPETEEEMNGIVTCIEEHDMPQLRKAMAAPATPIQRAALAPSSDQLEHFATLLPRETTQAHVFEIFPVIATSGSDYYIPSFGSPLRLAEKLSSIERLTIGERWLLGNAPVNVRDAEVLQAFTTFVERFSIDESLKVTQWIQAQGMSATLQAFREAEDVMSNLQAEHEVQEDGEVTAESKQAIEQKTVPEIPLPGIVVNFATNANLVELESLHRCLGLYLWLHHRFSLRFPQAAEARLFKTEVQNGIDFILQHMSPAAKAAKLAQEEQSRKRAKARR